jgi:hypothetical protein
VTDRPWFVYRATYGGSFLLGIVRAVTSYEAWKLGQERFGQVCGVDEMVAVGEVRVEP